jgi:hypothetical protein
MAEPRDSMTPPGGKRLRLGSGESTWEQFEQFCLALFGALPEVKSVNRYGGRGEKQDGIDLEIRFANRRKGSAQCRQRAKFGKSDFTKAVAENAYEGTRHIVVTSAVASVRARKASKATPGWELWDIDDIGVRVRSLDRVVARWLVEDHLGTRARREFLGPDGPLLLARWERYFRRLLQPDRLFSHTLPLAGRRDTLARIDQFLSDRNQRIAILPGRGGSGKSRILLELARSRDSDQRPILFVREGSPLTIPGLDAEIPAGPSVLVVEDAHRRDDVASAVAFVDAHPDVKMILSTRSHGVDELQARMVTGGFDPSELCVLPSLDLLSRDESRDIVRSVMDTEVAEEVAEALGDATRDCQLITVLAARLLSRKLIPLGLLSNQQELRDVVLGKFRDELLGRVPDVVPREKLVALLPIVAGVQPLRDNDARVMDGLADLIGATRSEVIGWLDDLEHAGLLLRAGNLRRVTPDVLSDYLLEGECVDGNGNPTGYAERLWELFAEPAGPRVLSNLSELDWRIRVEAGASTLLDGIWTEIRETYRHGDAFARTQIAPLIAAVAMMQPERVLELAEIETRAPARSATDPIFGASWTARDIWPKLALAVKGAGLHPQHVRRAMHLLWLLGRDDPRPQPQNTDHPLRLLAELGSYERPAPYQIALVELVESLLANPDGHDAAAIALLAPLMAREILSARGAGRRVLLQGRLVDRRRTRDIRARVIGILGNATLHGGERAAAAVEVIKNAMYVPFGLGGAKLSKEVMDQWRPEQRVLLDELAAGLANKPHASIAAQIRQVLRDHQERGRWPATRKRAKEILTRFPPTLHEELVDVFEHPWGGGVRNDHREVVARRFVEDHSDVDEAACALNLALEQSRRANPTPFLRDLAGWDAKLTGALLDHAIENPQEPLIAYAGALLDPASQPRAVELWGSNEIALRRLAAHAYAIESRDLDEDDQRRLREMLHDADDIVRRNATLAVTRIGDTNPCNVVAFAAAASPQSAHEIDELVSSINLNYATDEQLAIFLAWLEDVDRLSWEAGEFIKRAAPRSPRRVIELLITRVQDGRGIGETIELGNLLDELDADSYKHALVFLRDAALDQEAAWRLGYLVPTIARGSYEEVLEVLVPWLVDADENKVRAACSLFNEIPSWVVFRHHQLLADTLDRAAIHPYLQQVEEAIAAAAVSGITTRTPGEPAPDHTHRMEEAGRIAAGLPSGSAGRAFFERLQRSFRERIEEDRRRDEEEDVFGG